MELEARGSARAAGGDQARALRLSLAEFVRQYNDVTRGKRRRMIVPAEVTIHE